MDKKYSEEMDVLLNDFNTEYKNILNNRSIEELGINELQQLFEQFAALDSLNKDLISRARSDSDFDYNELNNLITKYEHLYEDNRVSLVTIDKELQNKKALLEAKQNEIEVLKSKQEKNINNLNLLNETYDKMKLSNTDESILKGIESSLAGLEEMNRDFETRIEVLNGEIDELENGIKPQTIEVDKVQEVVVEPEKVENKTAEEEISKTINDFIKQNPGVLNTIINTSPGLTPLEIVDRINEYNNKKEPQVKDIIPEEKKIEPQKTEIKDTRSVSQILNDFDRKYPGELQDIVRIDPNISVDELLKIISDFEKRHSNDAVKEDKKEIKESPEKAIEEIKDMTSHITPKNEPNVIKGSLKDLVAKGTLPNNLGSNLLSICSMVGINAKDMNFVPNQEQLQRLLNDKQVKLAFVNSKIASMHKKEVKGFETISMRYDRMKGTSFGENVNNRINSESNDIKREASSYERKASSIGADSVLEHLDMNSANALTKARVEHLDKKSDKYNEKIRKEYEKLDAQRQVKSNTKIKKHFTDMRIQKSLKRIERLQAKETKISSKQFDIMNDQANKYRQKKEKDLEKYRAKQRKTQKKMDKINNMMDEIKNKSEMVAQYNADLSHTDNKSLSDKVERFRLNQERKKIVNEVKRLSNKVSKCDRSIQVSINFDAIKDINSQMTEEPAQMKIK